MSENKKIAKNSVILYIRLVVTTIIGLYVSRIVLLQLGAEDYGLYAIVGGIVSMMNFLNVTLVSTTNRFIAVELGKGDKGDPNKQFNISLVLHIAITILLVLIILTIGVVYVKNYLNIPQAKEDDAIFVLFLSMIATIFTYIAIPFRGLVTAMENFKIRVLIEIFNAILRLGLVLLLTIYLGNKLKAYAVIMAITVFITSSLFIYYSYRNYYDIVRWKFNNVLSEYSEMLRYSGWVMLGVFASIARNQGAAIVINIFFGIILNAAFGIANQVNNYIKMFVRNLSQAAVPQIMKSHSGGDTERSINLVYYISKYSFSLMLLISTPILFNLAPILNLWLKEVPEYTYQFTMIMIVTGLFSSLFTGFDAAIHATGKVRASHISYSIIMVLSVPLTYFLYKIGYPPYTISIIALFAEFINQIAQILIVSRITNFSFKNFFHNTLVRSLFVSLSFPLLYFIRKYFFDDLLSIILFSVITVVINLVFIFTIGLGSNEKQIIINNLRKIKLK